MLLLCLPGAQAASTYEPEAREVTQYIQRTYYKPASGLYARSPKDRADDFMWSNGVMFSALVAAARHDPDSYRPVMDQFFKAMDHYWDPGDKPPGYEPAPTNGGHDKYYDDNAWMVITFAEAYQLTRDQRYADRATQTLRFVLSGWDDQLGGGIWWHEGHKGGSKNTCANAPAAVGCLRVARYLSEDQSQRAIAEARKITDWTTQTFQDTDGLFFDSEKVATQKMNKGKLTYNSALMLRAWLGLYRYSHNPKDLEQAKRIGKAAGALLDQRSGAYRDSVKWSHLMVEADLELYRQTGEDYLIRRARNNADAFYRHWKDNPPSAMIDNASIARTLWLLADTESARGKAFWATADLPAQPE